MNWLKKIFQMFKSPHKERIKDVQDIITTVKRARDERGRYRADDPDTPENEAFETVTVTVKPEHKLKS